MTAPTTTVQARLLNNNLQTITGDTVEVSIVRGKTGAIFEDIDAGRATVRLNNEDRTYDPLYSAGTHYGFIRPGAATDTIVKSGGLSIFTGMLGDLDIDYEVSGRTVATFDCEDDLALLGRQEFDEWTATSSQAAGARLTAVIARSEVNVTGDTAFDTGVSTLQGDLVTWGSNVLNYCQLVSRSDLGFFFSGRTGDLTFKDRHSTVNGDYVVGFSDGTDTSAYTTLGELLTEDGDLILTEDEDPILVESSSAVSTIRFHGIATSIGSELFYNRVSVDREGGTAQTVTNASNGASDGFRSLSLGGLLQDSDAQALSMAEYLLGIYEEPTTRIKSIRVKLEGLTNTQQEQVLALDLSSVVSVTWTPNGTGAAIDKRAVVQGIEHSIVPGEHMVTLHFTDESQFAMFTLDDAVLGELDDDFLGF